MPATVAQAVAKSVVGNIAAGFCEPAAARTAMTPKGKSEIWLVLIAKDRHMASEATPRLRFNFCKCIMALIPKGVAAFPRPIILADMFMIMADMAGCSGGTSGNNFVMMGFNLR